MAINTYDDKILEHKDDSMLETFKISTALSHFPIHILDHAPTLRLMDLSGTGISALPDSLSRMACLQVAFFSNCRFKIFPQVLAACPELEMVAFRGNEMTDVPENCLPPKLRWLILTNNSLQHLPASIGKCSRLEKCMLAGNRLQSLPKDLACCQNLALLRLSSNRINTIPIWLFDMPRLAFLSLSGNPCCGDVESFIHHPLLVDIPWDNILFDKILGEGASGTIHKATWQGMDVAVKLFKGDITSDGTPMAEMIACIAAGQHENLINTYGRIVGHPTHKGLVMQLVPSSYKALGLPPSLQTCIRDCFAQDNFLSGFQSIRLLVGVAAALQHVHSQGICHGDIYAHNILVDNNGNAILGDYGAASVYEPVSEAAIYGEQLLKLEVLAFGQLIEDVLELLSRNKLLEDVINNYAASVLQEQLFKLQTLCIMLNPKQRPIFSEIYGSLYNIYQEYIKMASIL